MGRSSTVRKGAPRDPASKVAQQRLSVLELVREPGHVAETCRQRDMDRTSFHEWNGDFRHGASRGLRTFRRSKNSHPQTTPPETVEKIKALGAGGTMS